MPDETDAIFASLTDNLVLDEHIEQREKLRARAAHLRAEADALDAEADLLGASRDELDCRIVPEHFSRHGDWVMFTAPRIEREKMRHMIPSLKARSMRSSMLLRGLAEEDPEVVGVFDEMPDELADAAIDGLTVTLSSMPSVATIEVVSRTIDAERLSPDELAAWLALYSGMRTSTQARIEAAYTMAELAGDEIPDEVFEDERAELAELNALCTRLQELLAV